VAAPSERILRLKGALTYFDAARPKNTGKDLNEIHGAARH
jgi:hypothetical protein